jgi:hypothetical protein
VESLGTWEMTWLSQRVYTHTVDAILCQRNDCASPDSQSPVILSWGRVAIPSFKIENISLLVLAVNFVL